MVAPTGSLAADARIMAVALAVTPEFLTRYSHHQHLPTGPSLLAHRAGLETTDCNSKPMVCWRAG